MKSTRNLIIKKVNGLPLQNKARVECLIDQPNRGRMPLDVFCIEGSSMRASGSAPILSSFPRTTISPDQYLQSKKNQGVKGFKQEPVNSANFFHFDLKRNQTDTPVEQNKAIKLCPLPEIRQKERKLELQFVNPVSVKSLNPSKVVIQQAKEQIIRKKLEPLVLSSSNSQGILLHQQLNGTDQENENLEKQIKVKRKKKKIINSEIENSSLIKIFKKKRILTCRQALEEIIKILNELEIISETDEQQYPEQLDQLILNLLNLRDKLKQETLLSVEKETYQIIYQASALPLVQNSLDNSLFRKYYQYIGQKLEEILQSTQID